MFKKKVKMLVGILISTSMLSFTALAAGDQFDFSIMSNGPEKGDGNWVTKSVSAQYANTTVDKFSGGNGVYLYVKDSAHDTVTSKREVHGTGHFNLKYKTNQKTGKQFKIYAKGISSSSNQAIRVVGAWTP